MNRLLISELRPGMVLAADIVGSNRRLLLSRGTSLEERHLRILNIWGVQEVCVQHGDADRLRAEVLGEIDSTYLAMARERVADRFAADCPRDAHMEELRRLCELEYAGRFAQGWHPCMSGPVDVSAEASAVRGMSAAEFVDSDRALASFPDIYFRLTEAMEDPSSSAAKLAEIIALDPSISVRLLNLVNSPFYGFYGPVNSLARCVTLLGTKELSHLVLGITVMGVFSGLGDHVIPVRELWKHSLACGVFCRIIATTGLRLAGERYFIMGMLHDIGRLAMLQIDPHASVAAMSLANREGISLSAAEERVFGFTHSQVAVELFARWKLPVFLGDVIGRHHAAQFLEDQRDAALCALGNVLSQALEYGTNGCNFVHSPAANTWELLNIPVSLLQVAIRQGQRQIADIYSVFLR